MADFLKQDVQGRPEFTVAKTFSEGNDFCAGLLHLPPGAMKPGRNSGSYCFVTIFFFIRDHKTEKEKINMSTWDGSITR